MKIVLIGGGSVSWTPTLVTDIVLTPALAGAHLVLHDIDAEALALLTKASGRIVEELGGDLEITATTDRAEALQGADYVILCVAIGRLPAMRNDLEIPQRYGTYQSVGDTVGPGGLARGLRNIPFALTVARDMEQICPDAWMLNLTNPMTTICRAVTCATSIRTIGLCHEISGVRRTLSRLLEVEPESISLQVAGINHLPVVLQSRIGHEDGLELLRGWLGEHGAFVAVDQHDPDPKRDVFRDRLAVKLSLFQQTGMLFGAGDRHVAEFFPGFLTEATGYGRRYGVELTTIAQREELARVRWAQLERFVVGEAPPQPLHKSEEQMTGVIAALAGGPAGRFIVNVPNQGQIDNLAHGTLVECFADISALGVQPLSVGSLPWPAYAAITPHVARQELIVEAALTGERSPALAALATDPLVHDPAAAGPMLDELLQANTAFVTR
jgi:alpha-galactosidase